MDSLQLREMLFHIGETTKCPQCKSVISTAGVKLQSIKDTQCILEFSCSKCKEIFNGYAELRESKTPLGKKLNASSAMMIDSRFTNSISENEVQGMHHLLSKNVSFENLFSAPDAPVKKPAREKK